MTRIVSVVGKWHEADSDTGPKLADLAGENSATDTVLALTGGGE